MAKAKSIFVCQNCNAQSPKWTGQCSECGEWNTLVESVVQAEGKKRRGAVDTVMSTTGMITKFSDVQNLPNQMQRVSTGMEEFDRVLGSTYNATELSNGLVKGSVVLLGGEPGIGKSTILTQMIAKMLINGVFANIKNDDSGDAVDNGSRGGLMYVSGEESPSQIALRIERIVKMYSKEGKKPNQRKMFVGADSSWKEKFQFVTTTNVDEICSIIQQHQPSLLVVDSIQTLFTNDLIGASGSVGQLRESTQRITQTVKSLNIPTFLVGHVTKDGDIAGPKILEHIVDAVLELSGERTSDLRVLRAIKNRFGATDEVGLFAMTEHGLAEVSNPSEFFLSSLTQNSPGNALACIMEGTRPLLIEIQSLVLSSNLAMPRRVCQGIALSRLQVLTAVLQKHLGLPLGEADVFVNIAGGLQVKEPSIDLATIMSIASSHRNKPLPEKTVFIGEVGLLGELRSVPYIDKRTKEAKRLGFSTVVSYPDFKHIRDVVKTFLPK